MLVYGPIYEPLILQFFPIKAGPLIMESSSIIDPDLISTRPLILESSP